MPGQLALLQGAVEMFPALVRDVDAAQRLIRIESYILNDDPETRILIASLERAVRRGVEVQLLLDGFGGQFGLRALGQVLAAGGISVRLFRPGVTLFSPRTWRRLHRKMVLIDERVGYVGGINLLGDWHDPHHGALEAPRFDFAVRIEDLGVTRAMRRAMQRLWWRVSWHGLLNPRRLSRADLREAWRGLRKTLRGSLRPTIRSGSLRVRLLLRDNIRHRRVIERAIRAAISQSRHEVLIAMAYFIPSARMRRLLIEAAARGVRVRILLQGRVEYWWSTWAERALAEELIAAGVEVYEFTHSFLHAKVVIADDWTTVGSSNMDPFSMLLSLEANVAVQDHRFAERLRSRIEWAMSTPQARRVTARLMVPSGPLAWPRRGLRRLGIAVASLAIRLFLAFSQSGARSYE